MNHVVPIPSRCTTYATALLVLTGTILICNSGFTQVITGTITGAVGPGRAAATLSKTAFPGAAIPTGGRTALGNFGAGFFARRRSANLPPPR